jgi:hypothetical protein
MRSPKAWITSLRDLVPVLIYSRVTQATGVPQYRK